MLRLIVVLTLIVVALLLIDRLFLWFERRGWMYWRRTKGQHGGGMGNALMDLHSILDPEAGRAAEERKIEVTREDLSGEPPEPGADETNSADGKRPPDD